MEFSSTKRRWKWRGDMCAVAAICRHGDRHLEGGQHPLLGCRVGAIWVTSPRCRWHEEADDHWDDVHEGRGGHAQR